MNKSLDTLCLEAYQEGIYSSGNDDLTEIKNKQGDTLATVYNLGGVYVVGGVGAQAAPYNTKICAFKAALTIALRETK